MKFQNSGLIFSNQHAILNPPPVKQTKVNFILPIYALATAEFVKSLMKYLDHSDRAVCHTSNWVENYS